MKNIVRDRKEGFVKILIIIIIGFLLLRYFGLTITGILGYFNLSVPQIVGWFKDALYWLKNLFGSVL